MYWFWTIIFFGLTFSSTKYFVAEASKHHQKKLSSAVLVGTVYCDTCFHQDSSKTTHFIEDASVLVECKDSTTSRPNFSQEVKTNKHGEFKVHLPFSVSKHTKKIKGCSVKLISSNEPFCAVAATATSSNLRLKSRKRETHIFSAGFFTFKPLNQPEVCDQKPIIKNPQNAEKLLNPNDPTFLPPVSNKEKESQLLDKKVNQPMGLLFPPLIPPNPLLPPPSLIPPNPLVPPPSLIPPVIPSPPPSLFPPFFPSPPPSLFPPFFPSPPPSLFPPFFPTPSPPSLFPPLFPHLPPIPGLAPSPPPPPPPIFPIPIPFPPFPPFPFQPTPGFPGVPPAVVSSQSKTSSP